MLFRSEEMKDSVKMPRSLWTGYTVDFLEEQLERESATFADSLWPNPAKEKLGTLRSCDIYDWTSGFFPGSLWYAYELTGNERLKEEAIRYTNRLYPVRKKEMFLERPELQGSWELREHRS